MSVRTQLLRYAGPDFSSRIEVWQDRAACAGEDPSIFHILSAEDPGCEDLSEAERKELENSNFAKAQKICSACPVRKECGLDGGQPVLMPQGQVTYQYNSFSLRGGELPLLHTSRSSGRPATYVEGQSCPQGHDPDRIYVKGNRRKCRECERLRRRRVAGKPSEIVTVKTRHADGEFGHAFREAPTAPWRCLTCKNEQRRAARSESGVAETPEERHERKHGHKPRYNKPKNGPRRCLTCARTSNAKRENRLAF